MYLHASWLPTKETEDERRRRLEKNRLNKEIARDEETEEERAGRFEKDRHYKEIARKKETEDELRKRLEKDRLNKGAALKEETENERRRRLEKNRLNKKIALEEETEEERAGRLEKDRLNREIARKEKTGDKSRKRLEKDRLNRETALNEETEDERRTTLEKHRTFKSAARLKVWKEKENAAFKYSASVNYSADPSCQIGSMSFQCKYCSAFKWKQEAPELCCLNGKVDIPYGSEPPEFLRTLYSEESTDAKHFVRNFRRYNACFSMTSFGAEKEVKEAGFMPTLKVQGQVYHRVGSLEPSENERPKFLQVYFISDTEQLTQRCKYIENIKPKLVSQLQAMLHQENNYVRDFKMTMEKLTPDAQLIISADPIPAGEHKGRFNIPSSSEVAIIMAGEKSFLMMPDVPPQ
ncbi:uncharacterized protein LOC129232184 [Uloborus diversus]|uniref:uncharacterized protein LOC129232184 n=1 Tax=Uloborus diversus TaxID=327109 RepID=UPI0024093640|nr:uncharacterized protein LOC129232184 [Uloborus diversus]